MSSAYETDVETVSLSPKWYIWDSNPSTSVLGTDNLTHSANVPIRNHLLKAGFKSLIEVGFQGILYNLV